METTTEQPKQFTFDRMGFRLEKLLIRLKMGHIDKDEFNKELEIIKRDEMDNSKEIK